MSKEINAKVVKVIDNGIKLAINKGINDGIERNMEFRVYETTEELFDPDTGESLGELFISKGDGTVIDVQPTMSIILSDKLTPKGGIAALSSAFYGREYVRKPFDNAKRGDCAKLINYQEEVDESEEEQDPTECIRCGNNIEEYLQEEGNDFCEYCNNQKEKIDKDKY